MTRLLTNPRVALLAATLAILPASVFAQMAPQDSKTAAPASTDSTLAKPADTRATSVAPADKKAVDSNPVLGKTVAPMSAHAGAHGMKHASVAPSAVKKTSVPATGAAPMSSKSPDQSK